MSRILLTGGAGYIGSILTERLLITGHHVTVLDNFRWGQASLNHLCHEPKLKIVIGDVRDYGVVKPLLSDVDYLIPLAALVGAPLCDRYPDEAAGVNIEAVVEEALSAPNVKIIFPNTNSGYGIGDSDGECTEESPLRPVSLYGRLKVGAEEAVIRRGNAVSLRLATVFGMSPRMRLDLLVNDFVYRAATDRAVVLFEPDFRRNYIHVRDVSRAFTHVMENFYSMVGEAYNVGLSSANMTKRQLCEAIAKQVPGFTFVEAPIGEDPDKRNYIVSNAKIEATGWRPIYKLEDGISEMLKGFRQFRRAHSNV